MFAYYCVAVCMCCWRHLTSSSLPPVAERRRSEASTENTSLKVTGRFPLLCVVLHITPSRRAPLHSCNLPLLSLFLGLPSSVSSLRSLILLNVFTELNVKVVFASGTSNLDRCFVYPVVKPLQVSFLETSVHFKLSSFLESVSS